MFSSPSADVWCRSHLPHEPADALGPASDVLRHELSPKLLRQVHQDRARLENSNGVAPLTSVDAQWDTFESC